jgi:hypothetical protein
MAVARFATASFLRKSMSYESDKQAVEAAVARDNAAADAIADAGVGEMKKSKWTAWIILAVALVVTFLIIMAL